MEENKERLEYVNNKCPNCGSDLAFLAGTNKLKCESCGSEFDIESIGQGRLDNEEKDFYQAIKTLEKTSRSTTAKIIKCKDCGASFDVNERTASTTCPYCGSFKAVVEEEKTVLSIDGVIPFVVTKDEVGGLFTKWVKKKVFAPRALRKKKASDFKGFYVPLFTFDSKTSSYYTAQRGDYYYVTRTVQTSNGTRVEKERKIRWTSVSGYYNMRFDDIIVRATNTKFNKYLDKNKQFELAKMEKFQPQFLLGYDAERASLSLTDGFTLAKGEMSSIIERNVESKIGGDEVRNLRISTTYDDVSYKNIMAPIYFGSFNYKQKDYDFVVNGQTGKFSGKYPKSAIKISLLVFFILAIIVATIIIVVNM